MHVAGKHIACLSVLLLAACEGHPTLAADGALPRYQICSIDGECGPEPRFDPLVGYISQVSHGQQLKYVFDTWTGFESFKAWSYSEIYSNKIASARVDATTYTYPGCNGPAQVHRTMSATVSGIGRAEVYTRFEYLYPNKYGFQIVATHTFSPAPGYGGGGTYTSEASECDNTY